MSKHGPLRLITSAAAVLLVVAFAEYLVLPRFLGFDRIMALVRSLDAVPLVAALGLETAALVSYSCLTRATLPRAGRPGLGTLFRLDLTTFGFSHVAPVSGISANALRYRLLTSAGVRRSDAMFTTVVQGSARPSC